MIQLNTDNITYFDNSAHYLDMVKFIENYGDTWITPSMRGLLDDKVPKVSVDYICNLLQTVDIVNQPCRYGILLMLITAIRKHLETKGETNYIVKPYTVLPSYVLNSSSSNNTHISSLDTSGANCVVNRGVYLPGKLLTEVNTVINGHLVLFDDLTVNKDTFLNIKGDLLVFGNMYIDEGAQLDVSGNVYVTYSVIGNQLTAREVNATTLYLDKFKAHLFNVHEIVNEVSKK